MTLTRIAVSLLSAGICAFAQAPANLPALTGVTRIPSGTGTFTRFTPTDPIFPGDPAISFGKLAFFGAGTAQQGIYVATPTDPIRPVANLTTPIPGGTGVFVKFAGDPSISGNNVAFFGAGSANQQGIYVAIPGEPIRPVADLNTPIPGGYLSFTGFQPAEAIGISGSNVVFLGFGTSGQAGVYLRTIPTDPTQPGDPVRIADTHSPIPGGTGTFTAFLRPVVSGANVAYLGLDPFADGGASGVYFRSGDPLQPGDPIRIADISMLAPNQPFGALFTAFTRVSLSGSNVAFVGVYAAGSGVYVATPTDPVRPIADTSTLVPGGAGHFIGFGNVAIDGANVVFEATALVNGTQVVKGIYGSIGDTLRQIASQGATMGTKQVADLHFGVGGFSGGQVAFAADFTDGSQGVGVATPLGASRCPAGQNYWKDHPSQWPETTLTLGNQNYSQAELLALLSQTGTDASVLLARQLITAKLNALSGTAVNPAAGAIGHADGLLEGFEGKLPYKTNPYSTMGQAMGKDSYSLTNYSEGRMTSGCPCVN